MNGGLSKSLVVTKGQRPQLKSSYRKSRFSLEDDIGLLEQLLADLDVETAFKILNLLEEHPDILEDVLSTSSCQESPYSEPIDDFSQSKPESPGAIEEIIQTCDSEEYTEERPSSSTSHKYIIDKTMERLMSAHQNGRPLSTSSIHTRSSSITSEDLVQLLRTSSVNLLSRANSSSLRKSTTSVSSSEFNQERPITSMALTHFTSDDQILWSLDQSRPPTSDVRTIKAPIQTIFKQHSQSRIPKATRSANSSTKVSVSTLQFKIEDELVVEQASFSAKKKSARPKIASNTAIPKEKSTANRKSPTIKSITRAIRSIRNPPVIVKEPSMVILDPIVIVIPTKCNECNKKTRVTALFKCRCGFHFCGNHRFNDKHKCTFNYKEAGKEALIKDNPMTRKDKLNKI